MKTALITGITGQDGAYLSRFLLDRDYVVHGIVPRCEVDNTLRLNDLFDHPRLNLHQGDITDGCNLLGVLSQSQPDEIYNLAAQSHVATSFEVPEATAQINGIGVLKVLEIVRQQCPQTKFYQASSSELFGNAPAPQTENTPMNPCSPYAAAKLYAYHMVKVYRQAYGLFAANGILFNHESPLRGEDFVTKKVTQAVARKAAGYKEALNLGNLDARRDWGHARDYVRGMWMILQQDRADDFILSTGRTYQVRQLVETAFKAIDIEVVWQGKGIDEKGINAKTAEVLVKVDPGLYRPNELHMLCGDPSKAREVLGWHAETSFEDMIKEMVAYDCNFVTEKEVLDYAA